MRLLVKKRGTGELEFGIIYGVIAIAVIGAAYILPLTELAPACHFRSITGVPCPTCGSTRSLVHLSHGQMKLALVQNPLFSVILLFAVAYFVVSCLAVLLKLPRVRFVLSPFERNLLIAAACFIIAANWAYLIFMP